MRIPFLACSALILVSGPALAKSERVHALGTEPFWSLDIGPRTMVFDRMDHPKITQRTPKPKLTRYGRIYWTKRIQVEIIRNQPCSDGMSDYIYRDDVKVTVDGEKFIGCAGPRHLADYAKDN